MIMSAPDGTRNPPKARFAAAVDWTLLAIAIVVIVAIPKSISGDGSLRYEAIDHFMTTGQLTSPRYSTVGPLLSTPLYLLGRALGAARPVTALYNSLLFLFALWLIWRDFCDELTPAVRRMLLLLLVFASMFAHHVQYYYGEVFTTVAVTIGVFWLSRGHWARGWALLVLGAVNTPASLIGIGAIAICHARQTRRWLPLLGPVTAFALMSLESLLVRGFWTGPSRVSLDGS